MQYEHDLNCSTQGSKHGEGRHPQVRVLEYRTSQRLARLIIGRTLFSNPLWNANLHSHGHCLLIQEQLQHVETDHQHAHHLHKGAGGVKQTANCCGSFDKLEGMNE